MMNYGGHVPSAGFHYGSALVGMAPSGPRGHQPQRGHGRGPELGKSLRTPADATVSWRATASVPGYAAHRPDDCQSFGVSYWRGVGRERPDGDALSA